MYANQFSNETLSDASDCIAGRSRSLSQWKNFFLFISIAYRSLQHLEASYTQESNAAVFPLNDENICAEYVLNRLAVIIQPVETLLDVLHSNKHVSLLQFHYCLHMMKNPSAESVHAAIRNNNEVSDVIKSRMKLFQEHFRNVTLERINQLMLSKSQGSGLSLPYILALHAALFPPYMRSKDLILSSDLNHKILWEYIKNMAVNIAMKQTDATTNIKIAIDRSEFVRSENDSSIHELVDKWLNNHVESRNSHQEEDSDSSDDEEDKHFIPQAAFAGSTSSTANSDSQMYLRMQYNDIIFKEIKSYFSMKGLPSNVLSLSILSKHWMKSMSKCPHLALIAQAFYGLNCSGKQSSSYLICRLISIMQ